jgi:hypothetical protein
MPHTTHLGQGLRQGSFPGEGVVQFSKARELSSCHCLALTAAHTAAFGGQSLPLWESNTDTNTVGSTQRPCTANRRYIHLTACFRNLITKVRSQTFNLDNWGVFLRYTHSYRSSWERGKCKAIHAIRVLPTRDSSLHAVREGEQQMSLLALPRVIPCNVKTRQRSFLVARVLSPSSSVVYLGCRRETESHCNSG